MNSRSPLLSSLRQSIGSLFLRLYPSERVSGVVVFFSDLDVERGAATSRLNDALELVRRLSPRRHRRILRYTKHIVVWSGHYTAYDSLGGIHMASSYLMGSSTDELAGGLVHEATHLRIARQGIPYAPALRSRIEAICVRQQADFLRSTTPRGGELAAEAEQSLAHPWWTPEEDRKDIELLVSNHGMPRWVAALLAKVKSAKR